MSYLQNIFNQLGDIALRLTTGNIQADDVEEFGKLLNQSIPNENSEDGIRYDEFHTLFNLSTRIKSPIINSLKEAKGYNQNEIRCKILWTAAYYIVREFELEDVLFLQWLPKVRLYKIQVMKQIEGLDDPYESGYSFEYRLENKEKNNNKYNRNNKNNRN
jgi:hypothetical protein